MKDEATLSQVNKVLSYLNGLDAEQANRALGRIGEVFGEVRNEGPAPHYNYTSPEVVAGMWEMILKTVPHKDIVITIAHDIYGDHIRNHRCRYQLRCWRGVPGTQPMRGQWGSGDHSGLLFQTLIEKPPSWECVCCWEKVLKDSGLYIANVDGTTFLDPEKSYWRRAKIVGGKDYKGEFGFDVIAHTHTKTTKEEMP